MKVGAHPVLVAVALGLLGPGALEITEDDRRDAITEPCEDAMVQDTPEPIDDAEWHRVEELWLAARETV